MTTVLDKSISDATLEEVLEAAQRIGFGIPNDHHDDYLGLMEKTDAACRTILGQPDYKPVADTTTYPRLNVHLPQEDANPLKGWAWRAEIQGKENGLLSGKTVVFKDTVCIADVPLLFGTDAFEGYIPDVDATVVSRILDNGGMILGKAACENFSHGATSSSSPFGPVENPYAKGFTTGGSSSGCGALIGSGEADMGIGGDQGGSIRIPASFCGIVGLKPTFGLVPYTGVLSSDAGLDHVGPMARTVLDTAKLLEATAGYDRIDDRQLGAPLPKDVPPYSQFVLTARAEAAVKGMRLALLKNGFACSALCSSVETLVRDAIHRFEELGATVEEVSVPTFSLAPQLGHIINKLASGGTRQGRQVGRRGLYLNDYWDQLLPWTPEKYNKAKYFVTGTAMSCEYAWSKYPTVYGRAMNLTRKMRDELDAVFTQGHFDAILMPTIPQPARRHIPAHAGPLGWAEHAPGTVVNTSAFNQTGHPALTIPVGFSSVMPEDVQVESDKDILLPVGMQLVGAMWEEAKLLQIADAWEQNYDWHKYVQRM